MQRIEHDEMIARLEEVVHNLDAMDGDVAVRRAKRFQVRAI